MLTFANINEIYYNCIKDILKMENVLTIFRRDVYLKVNVMLVVCY
jgi:hypothetical protein